MKTPSEVDQVIQALGNYAANAEACTVTTIDAMVIALGARLTVQEIEVRWRDRGVIRDACLMANAWIAGRSSDSELFNIAGCVHA